MVGGKQSSRVTPFNNKLPDKIDTGSVDIDSFR